MHRADRSWATGWIALAGLLWAGLGSLSAAADEPDGADEAAIMAIVGGCTMSDVELEAAGAVIRNVYVRNLNIFDLDEPEEDKGLFRVMNRLHVLTRPRVIRQQLLFAPGDPFRRRVLDESERILRQTSYLYDADIAVLACEEDGVDLLVRTQDVWTLKPGFTVSRSGGESRIGFDIQEDNFLGRGGSVRFYRRIDEERRTTEVGYSDRNLGGRWISLDTTIADYSDGHLFALSLERPFYALDTRTALGGSALDQRLEDGVYSLGDEIGKFRRDSKYFDGYFGWSDGLTGGWTHRLLAGFAYDDQRFASVEDSIDPALVPEDRKLVYPFLGYEIIEDRFERAINLDQIQRTEDVLLGARGSMRLGLLSSALGSDRDGLLFAAEASRGYGDPASMLWEFASHAEGRLESAGMRNMIVGGSARWYFRQSDRRLFYASLRGDVAESLDLDNPLEIGGDNGLRGYPLRYQRGDARMQLTLEQRYFTDYYLWRLFRVGGAVFFDAGRVWGDNPFGGENLGLLKDVGFGLRLASTRSSLGRMIHIDFAFPLDGDPTIDNFQFLIEGRRSF
jgi:hemolysin activation/secretion protein